MEKVNEKNNLFDNYTNYLYKVDNYEDIIENHQNKYVLFNPSIHYWIALDEIGVSIYNEIHNSSNLEIVKKNLIDKFSINDSIFNEDVLPFVEQLITSGFLSFNKTPKEASWMSKSCDISTVDRYPFRDIYISLTDKCNLNCLYCINKKERNIRLNNNSSLMISKDKIIDVLKEFKSMNGSKVIFTGGEPTLNNEFIEICREAKNIGLDPHFITNGTLLNSIDIDRLFEYVDSFTISLDSVIEKELQLLWGKSNIDVDKNIYAALERVNEFSLKKKRMTVVIKPIVSAININSLDKLVAAVNNILKDCEVSWAMTQFEKIDDIKANDLLSVTEEEYVSSTAQSLRASYVEAVNESTNKSANSLKRINGKINIFSLAHGGRLLPPKSPNLLSCNPSFYIAGNGDVFPCQCFEEGKYKIGNVFNDTLANMFENEIFKEIRAKLPINDIENKKCSKCELRFLCTNELGPCNINKNKIKDNCKQINIQKLFLQTQLS
ncbi:radical SAM protein [Clostridium sp. 19966]|uniref:radical SAM/SPASM domain-containing protein n=1 Tax=Clostridium sp. 19966 TaxID=2768166 RepID=UPI0028DE853D|nr:radical SAM protein [Clostridium sp. 19966]MDT8717557.1 radical SAM protein [Clostridium sp. 19966]